MDDSERLPWPKDKKEDFSYGKFLLKDRNIAR